MTPEQSKFDKDLMLALRDKIFELRTSLGKAREKESAQEAEINRLNRLLQEKIDEVRSEKYSGQQL